MSKKRAILISSFLSHEVIERKIYLIHGEKVMADWDLAELYGIEVKRLIEAVKRNRKRFPSDFMFQLTNTEYESLRSQFATSKRGGRRYLPYVFTEQGVSMLSSILNSDRAVEVNIYIIRTFVRLRKLLSTNKELAKKLTELEKKVEKHDSDILSILEAIRQLITAPHKSKREIGFHAK
jgi:hypothetical protein